MDIATLRNDYKLASLSEADVIVSPFGQFEKWFNEVMQSQITEPNAMTLATTNDQGRPAARIVLLKEFDERGFVFYTNYHSRKGRELATAGYAALLFFWAELERQVRIEGRIEKVSAAESDAYYQQRPLLSRIGAWASAQSTVLASREALEKRFAESAAEYGDNPPRPPHWGGYRLMPEAFEFWQGRRSRLHDRICYRLENSDWRIERLAP
ncbi:MAG: pyridoxamine 5'-phosphate oxidase [Betaproteobacteria bacterium]|nr:pyridoxamine 5'-phosphate oxidase [Betaproteobacteria bacterium]